MKVEHGNVHNITNLNRIRNGIPHVLDSNELIAICNIGRLEFCEEGVTVYWMSEEEVGTMNRIHVQHDRIKDRLDKLKGLLDQKFQSQLHELKQLKDQDND